MSELRQASGCMFGLAYGDALGRPTEFKRYEEIVAVYGPSGPRYLQGDPALVTDDTQMTLCVADALLAVLDQPLGRPPGSGHRVSCCYGYQCSTMICAVRGAVVSVLVVDR